MKQAGLLLTVYSREYCHLCRDMIAALETLQPRYNFRLEIVDVGEDEALEARYGELLPVLAGQDGDEICHYHLDLAALRSYLSPGQDLARIFH